MLAFRDSLYSGTVTARPWLQHYDYWVPPHLTYPSRPLWEILDAAFVEVPDRPATAFLGATLTYRDIKVQSDWFAAALVARGIRKGDRVAIMLPNCPQYVVAAFAVLRCGAILVNINPVLTRREIEVLVADSGARLLLTLDTSALVALAVQRSTSLEQIIVTSLAEYSADAETPAPIDGTIAFADCVRTTAPAPITRVDIDPDDVAVLQYTGGTTGVPKGAMLTHRSVFANVIQTEVFTYRSRARGEGRYLLVIPYFHAFGFTVGLMKGTWVGALQILMPKFDVTSVLTAVREFAPTYFPAVPTIWSALLAHPDVATSGLDRVRFPTSGAAPCPPELLERFERTCGRSIFEGFGLSEASPVTHSTPFMGLRKQGAIGVPMPDTDIKVVDLETGEHTLDSGEAGELCITGPQLMKGYWNHPAESARTLRVHTDGRTWLHTGDVATIDTDGYTRIVQRVKDLILVDGFNVYPSEVEAVLCLHPAVELAAAVGVPDARHGEVVRAFVVLRESQPVEVEALHEHCAANLAKYKRPVHIEIRHSLPLSRVGKVLYRELREELAAAAGSLTA